MPVIVLCLLTSNKNHLFCLLVSNKSIIFAHVFIFSIQMHHGNARPTRRASATKAEAKAETEQFTPRVMRFKRGNPWYATGEEIQAEISSSSCPVGE